MLREHYVAELDRTRADLLEMGALAEQALTAALESLAKPDIGTAERVRELEGRIDAFNKNIYDRCLSLMTLQAPVAGDARLLLGIVGAIVDLELVGDYAAEIAELGAGICGKPVSAALNEFANAARKVQDMLSQALESWRRQDRPLALCIRPMQAQAKSECERLVEKLTQLSVSSRDGSAYVGLILICKYLERIASHSVNVAEQVVFVVPSYS